MPTISIHFETSVLDVGTDLVEVVVNVRAQGIGQGPREVQFVLRRLCECDEVRDTELALVQLAVLHEVEEILRPATAHRPGDHPTEGHATVTDPTVLFFLADPAWRNPALPEPDDGA